MIPSGRFHFREPLELRANASIQIHLWPLGALTGSDPFASIRRDSGLYYSQFSIDLIFAERSKRAIGVGFGVCVWA